MTLPQLNKHESGRSYGLLEFASGCRVILIKDSIELMQ